MSGRARAAKAEADMEALTLPVAAAALVLAGLVKGAIGLGLPPIAMGLLVLVLPPVEAAALIVVPSILTNLWQALAGPDLPGVLRRLWPLLVASALGTLFGVGLMTPETARVGGLVLGLVLVAYAAAGLAGRVCALHPRHEPWAGPVVGGLTGILTAVTGVSAVPAVPYLQALGLSRDTLVQAMGLSFTISTLALGTNLARVGALSWSTPGPVALATVAVLVGLWLGLRVRRHVLPEQFRLLLFWGLLALGLYLVVRAVLFEGEAS